MAVSKKASTLLTVQQTASILCVHPDTVRSWLRNGELGGCRVGKAWRIPRRSLYTEDGRLRREIGPTA